MNTCLTSIADWFLNRVRESQSGMIYPTRMLVKRCIRIQVLTLYQSYAY